MITAELLAQQTGLSTGGWVVMLGCIGSVCALLAFCYWRVLRGPEPPEPHHDAPDFDDDLRGK